MTTNRKVDYIIIGQGLAGSAVAVQLLRRGKKILVIDQPAKNNSSRIAAGLFNPITGKKMVKTWMADEVFPYLHQFYREVESVCKTSFFYPTPLYRPFISIEEQNEWMARSADVAFKSYVSEVFTHSTVPQVNDPDGGLVVQQCGYLNTTEYILSVRQWISREGTFLEEDFTEESLKIDTSHVEYNGWTAPRIIFCQGTRQSRWFEWIPIRPLKGETISISADVETAYVINRGVYIVPAGVNKHFRVGATYFFQDRSEVCTDLARRELEEKLGQLISFPFRVIGQDWGFRPTTPDRRPIMGQHPDLKPLAVFNGLGTKGVSLAPYFSDVLIRSLENSGTLNNAVDVSRYKSVYWSVPKIV
ncbi:MAG: FAD-binding oxidoreductase [Cyclobacteriaceae bacterium]|nr:FAD-binding oxidoreductase [Cyclobacteriaceae bacterium]